jgi:hypothetical protein
VLAPNAKLRPEIVPGGPVNSNDTADDHGDAPPPSAPARLRWAWLLKRVFAIDSEQCPQCGGPLKIIATIEDPTVIAKILTQLGLSIRAPPRATFAGIRSTPNGLIPDRFPFPSGSPP